MSPTADNPILTTALRWGGLFAAALAVVASAIGWFVAGSEALWAALLGAGLAFVFLGLTAGSMILGRRLTEGDPNSPLFYGVVLGAWLLKLVVFFLFFLWLRAQAWIDPFVFFGTVVTAVLGSLVIDVLAFQRSRVPYAEVPLPAPGDPDGTDPEPDRTSGP